MPPYRSPFRCTSVPIKLRRPICKMCCIAIAKCCLTRASASMALDICACRGAILRRCSACHGPKALRHGATRARRSNSCPKGASALSSPKKTLSGIWRTVAGARPCRCIRQGQRARPNWLKNLRLWMCSCSWPYAIPRPLWRPPILRRFWGGHVPWPPHLPKPQRLARN